MVLSLSSVWASRNSSDKLVRWPHWPNGLPGLVSMYMASYRKLANHSPKWLNPAAFPTVCASGLLHSVPAIWYGVSLCTFKSFWSILWLWIRNWVSLSTVKFNTFSSAATHFASLWYIFQLTLKNSITLWKLFTYLDVSPAYQTCVFINIFIQSVAHIFH